MPIPQLEPKHSRPEYVRDASHIRKKRAQKREGSGSEAERSSTSSTTKNGKAPKTLSAKIKQFRKRLTKKNVLRWGGIAVAAGFGIFFLLAAGAYAWVSKDLADITDIERRAIPISTKVMARDGHTVLYEFGDNKRTDVALDQISPYIQQATIALEDKDFYEHKGVKITAILRAALSNFSGGNVQGGSTLTQQFIKVAVLSPEKTYTRKLKEAILALRLERNYTKDQILNMYLNEVYYGLNYQGAETSAQHFYGKSAKDVSLAEAATLAALPQNPPLLLQNIERLQGRRNYALDVMVEEGYITREEADNAKQEQISIQEELYSITAPHFVFTVRAYLDEKYGAAAVNKGGLEVVTTLDIDKQKKAEQAITDGMAKVEQYGGSNAALVSLDAHNGQILAMVGSRDYFDADHDGNFNVTTSPRQPGSSFKPIVYLTAFMKGYTPDTKVYDVETDFPLENGQTYHPRNYNLNENGPISLRNALSHSLNIPAVKTLYLVGVGAALDTAEKLGYTTLQDRSRFGLALVLGGAEVTLLEHTATYATFAREGEYHKPSAILSVKDKNGSVLEEWKDSPQQVVDKMAARTLNSVLSDYNARSAVFPRLYLADRPVAVKTGTTNDFHDAWTMGYTPSIATGVWVGNNNNDEMSRGADGSVIAAPIWVTYMNSVLQGSQVETFQPASYKAKTEVLGGNLDKKQTVQVDSETGKVIPDSCKDTYPEEYVVEKEIKETHTILHYLRKEEPTGAAPENPSADPMYKPWEEAVKRWADGQPDYTTIEKLGYADCNKKSKEEVSGKKKDDKKEDGGSNEEGGGLTAALVGMDTATEYTSKTLSLGGVVEPGAENVTQVDFYIDTVLIESKKELSVSGRTFVGSSYKPTNLTSGKHTVKIVATDAAGDTAEASLTIKYSAE